ncbi:hypothetical protein Sste5346_001860 [Sporothrix stenoceras]|uniref:Uncharacterized protein n=1 Tax=Sporothrix stenoceras TaxID=5173 RepID=A0ABR3ZN03_9PEZI
MHNLLHGNVNSYQPLSYNNPYQVNQGVNQGVNQAQSSRRPSQSQPPRPSQRHLRRPHLLPHAPPSSQQHSSSSSFSSQQQLAALQKQAANTTTTGVKKEEPQTTTMSLFSGFSLRGSKHNKMVRDKTDEKEETEKKPEKVEQKTDQKTATILNASIKPPVRKSDPVGRNRGPVDAKDLAQRLQTILAERGMQQTSSGSSVPPSPLEGPPPVQNGGCRIRSRGSGNLRAVYASNAPVVPTTTSGEQLRRQPFSAPHSLSAYKAAHTSKAANAAAGLVPPPTMDELQRRKNRTRSQSPQQVNMRGGGLPSSGTQDTLAQRRGITSVIPPSNAHHGVPYIPSQAAQQFQRTTHSVGGPRKSILLRKPRSPKEGYSHNQSVARSPTISQKGSEKASPAMSAKSPITPSSARAPSVKHAFKDTLAQPGSRRQSMKEGAEEKPQPEAEADTADKVEVEDTAEEADDEATAEAETDLDTEAKAKAAKAAAVKKPTTAFDISRIVQEHSVDWTQSDETSIQRKREKKEKKEREKHEKKAKQQQQAEEGGAAEERPLWRLKARLSSFSKDKRWPSPPAGAAAVAATSTTIVPEDTAETSAATRVEAAQEEGTAAMVGETKVEVQPTSNSSSVLSLTAMKKSSSFLALFKH